MQHYKRCSNLGADLHQFPMHAIYGKRMAQFNEIIKYDLPTIEILGR